MVSKRHTPDTMPAHDFQPLSVIPTVTPVLFFNRRADPLDLAETASFRLKAAIRLLEMTATYQVDKADSQALRAVSEAAYLLLSDGYDLFSAVAFDSAGERGTTDLPDVH